MTQGIRFVSGINEGLSVPLREGQEVLLGRTKSNDVVLPYDGFVSGKHASVKKQAGKIYLKDLKSTNGTFVNEERLAAGSYRQISGLFVVGSTLFETSDRCDASNKTPLPLNRQNMARFDRGGLLKAAGEQVGEAPILDSAYLFLGMLIVYGKALAPFFSEIQLEINPKRVKSRLLGKKLFRSKHAWFNQFLSFNDQVAGKSKRYMTPLVCDLLKADKPPLELLRILLNSGFNLVYPILHWEATEDRWQKAFEGLKPKKKKSRSKITFAGKHTPSYLEPLLKMDDFWTHLGETVQSGNNAVVTGDQGCGKTALLGLGLHQREVANLPASLAGSCGYFDPKTFFYLQGARMMGDYLNQIFDSLGKPELTVIDHTDIILSKLSDNTNLRRKLLRALRDTRFPLVLITSRDGLEQNKRQIGHHEVLDLNHYLGPVLDQVHEAILESFRNRFQLVIRPIDRHFFLRQVIAPDRFNLRAHHQFIELCAHRCHEIDSSLGRINEETCAVDTIGEAVFREVYESWPNWSKNTTEPVVPEPTHEEISAPSEAENGFADQVEELLQKFAKSVFKASLQYSDRTQRLSAKGRLSREQKTEELKRQLVSLIGAVQSAFPEWFEVFWMKLDPEIIIEELGRTAGVRKLWNEFQTRTKHIDTSYVEDQFHQTAAELFLNQLKPNKSGR